MISDCILFTYLFFPVYLPEISNFWLISKCITRIMCSDGPSSMLMMKDQNMWLPGLEGKPWRYRYRHLIVPCIVEAWCGVEAGMKKVGLLRKSGDSQAKPSFPETFMHLGYFSIVITNRFLMSLVITELLEFWPRYQTQNPPDGCFCQALHIMAFQVILCFSSLG